MSTFIYHQTSTKSSHVIEAATMKLMLVSPNSRNQNPPFDDSLNKEIHTTDSYLPTQKPLKLSQQSLEVCTESLGSETGSDDHDMNEFDPERPEPESMSQVAKKSSARRRDYYQAESKKVVLFPPPLMSLSGSKVFEVKQHREGGRLIIEAVETDLVESCCLQADRSHGRLRLMCSENRKESGMERKWHGYGNGDAGICSNLEPCSWHMAVSEVV